MSARSPVTRAAPSGLALANSITAAQATYAAQTVWFIDPTHGSDSNTGLTSGTALKTWAQYRSRVGSLGVVTSTITILNSLPVTDPLRPPYVPNGSQVTITGSPGAQTLAVSAVSASTAVNRSTNTANNITASTLSANWATAGAGGVTLLNNRLRVTAGARAGVICWPCKDTGTKSARLSQPLVPFPTTTTTALVIGDAFVVETLPQVGDLIFDQPVDPIIPGTVNLLFEGLDFSPCGNAHVPPVGVFGAIIFANCYVGYLEGWYEAIACQFSDYASSYVGAKTCNACLFQGDVQLQAGGMLYLSDGTLSQGGGAWAHGAGSTILGDLGVFDSSGAGIDVAGVLSTSTLWGSGNATYGVNVHPGGSLVWTTLPTIVGTTNGAIIGGTAKAWSAITAGFAAAGASAYPYV